MKNIMEIKLELIKQRTSGVETRQEELIRLDGMITACDMIQVCTHEQLVDRKETAELILARTAEKDFWTEGYLYALNTFTKEVN